MKVKFIPNWGPYPEIILTAENDTECYLLKTCQLKEFLKDEYKISFSFTSGGSPNSAEVKGNRELRISWYKENEKTT